MGYGLGCGGVLEIVVVMEVEVSGKDVAMVEIVMVRKGEGAGGMK